MAVSVINGSAGAGQYLDGATPDVIKVVTALDSMNNPAIATSLRGMQFLSSFMREVQGVQGHTEAFKANQAYVSDDGSFQDAVEYQESYGHWTFTRRGYTVKDRDFTHKMLLDADERNMSLASLVDDRIKVIMDLYLNKYLPNVAYETLFTLPTINGGGYYSEPKGFLKGQIIEDYLLKPSVDASVPRNHYRAIADAANQTLTIEDIEFCVEYLSDYADTSDSNIIALGTRGALFKLRQALAWDGNKDEFSRTGEPAVEFAGVRFIINDYIPRGMIFFVNGDAPELIVRLVSPKPQYRGMAIVKEEGFARLESIYDLVGSQFKIQPEGYHLTGRHYGLFLDVEEGNANREMTANGLQRLSDHANALRQRWYRNLR